MSSLSSQYTVSTLSPSGLAGSNLLPTSEDFIDLLPIAATIVCSFRSLIAMGLGVLILASFDTVRLATIKCIRDLSSDFNHSCIVLQSALESINRNVEELSKSDDGPTLVSTFPPETLARVRGVNTLFLGISRRASELSARMTPIPEPYPIVKMLGNLNRTAVALFPVALGVLASVFGVLSLNSQEGFVPLSTIFAILPRSISLAAALFGVLSWCQASVKDYARQATLRHTIATDTRKLSIGAGLFAKWWEMLSVDLEGLHGAIKDAGGLLGQPQQLVLLSHCRDICDKMRAYEEVEPLFREIITSQSDGYSQG